MAFAEDREVIGFEEGMSWLPSQVLDEAFSDTTTTNNNDQRHVKNQQHRHRPKLPAETLSRHSKNSPIANHRSKYPTNRGSRVSGMQAIFLESGQRSCGTVVFLPQRAGTDFQPTRNSDSKTNTAKGGNCNSGKSKNGNDVSGKCSVISQNLSSSADIFLPKEWTY